LAPILHFSDTTFTDGHADNGDFRQRKYIVFESNLLGLFSSCPVCAGHAEAQIAKVLGTLVSVSQVCTNCGYTRLWNSQPFVNQMALGNLILSGAMLFTGCLPTQVLRLFNTMNVACISRSTYHRHQRLYTIPTIIRTWQAEQDILVHTLSQDDQGLDVAGDSRSDSPGHSAKYGGYTLMEQRHNKVLDMQLVQVSDWDFITYVEFYIIFAFIVDLLPFCQEHKHIY
jgi:solute carrier family 8 (sodium/calcium exchanger)